MRPGYGCAGRLLKAMNLVTSRPARKAALVAPTRAGRALVLLPWRGRTLVGTSESADERPPDDQDARRDEVDGFLDEVNETFPALGLKSEEVTLVHRGIVPAVSVDGRLSLLAHSRVIDHADAGSPEVISVVGVKYTTARVVAERAVDLVLQKARTVAGTVPNRRHAPSRRRLSRIAIRPTRLPGRSARKWRTRSSMSWCEGPGWALRAIRVMPLPPMPRNGCRKS